MTKEGVCARIRQIGIIPAIHVSSSDEADFAIEALMSGGIPIVEIVITGPAIMEMISHLIEYHRSTIVGAGNVYKVEVARQCVDAGVGFITASGFNPAVVSFAAKEALAVFPGGLTPTEVVDAWMAGADFVKVFPCGHVGGDKYIKSLKTALPQVPLIAAGGVSQQTAADLIVAGADAIGIGTALIPAEAIRLRKPDRIRELAQRFTGFVRAGRDRLKA